MENFPPEKVWINDNENFSYINKLIADFCSQFCSTCHSIRYLRTLQIRFECFFVRSNRERIKRHRTFVRIAPRTVLVVLNEARKLTEIKSKTCIDAIQKKKPTWSEITSIYARNHWIYWSTYDIVDIFVFFFELRTTTPTSTDIKWHIQWVSLIQ